MLQNLNGERYVNTVSNTSTHNERKYRSLSRQIVLIRFLHPTKIMNQMMSIYTRLCLVGCASYCECVCVLGGGSTSFVIHSYWYSLNMQRLGCYTLRGSWIKGRFTRCVATCNIQRVATCRSPQLWLPQAKKDSLHINSINSGHWVNAGAEVAVFSPKSHNSWVQDPQRSCTLVWNQQFLVSTHGEREREESTRLTLLMVDCCWQWFVHRWKLL